MNNLAHVLAPSPMPRSKDWGVISVLVSDKAIMWCVVEYVARGAGEHADTHYAPVARCTSEDSARAALRLLKL